MIREFLIQNPLYRSIAGRTMRRAFCRNAVRAVRDAFSEQDSPNWSTQHTLHRSVKRIRAAVRALTLADTLR